jgi:hypothetical protein
MAPWSQNDAFARNVSQEPRPRECCWIQPVFDRNSDGLDHNSSIKVCVIRKFSQHHQSLPIIATFVEDKSDISVAIRSVLSPGSRAKKYRLIQPYVGGNPRKEIAYCFLCIWIQEFHKRYFGRNAESRQFLRN